MSYFKFPSWIGFNRLFCYEVALIALCFTGLVVSFFNREFVYFRDYAITFEGAYRIYLGQIPFKDFYLPVGPGSFLLPALFFKLFSPDWTVFLCTQLFENFLFIVIFQNILIRLHVRFLIRCASLAIFALLYLLLQTHPWYNTTAILIFFTVMWLSLIPKVMAISGAGLMVGLAILTKQDVGALAFFIGGFFIVALSYVENLNEIVPCLNLIRNRNLLLQALKRLLIFLLSVFLVIFVFAAVSDYHNFIYWFNYGQEPHERRTFMHWGLLGGLLAVLPGILFNNKKLFLSGVIYLAAVITRKTSGLEFTHYYYVGFIPVFIDEFLRVKNTKPAKAVILIILLVIMARPIRSAYYVFEAMALSQPEHFFFNYRKVSGPLTAMPIELHAFSSKMAAPQPTIDAIYQLKAEVERRRSSAEGAEVRILNITELTPIYAELNVLPPKRVPLWFHSKVTLFQEQVDELDTIFKSDFYDCILIQGTHEGLSATYVGLISTLDKNSFYYRAAVLKATPSNFTCAEDCQGDIYIYMKR